MAALDKVKPDVIIQGECDSETGGADYLAAQYAENRGLPCIGVKANWGHYGNAAGPIRNRWMAELCGPVSGVVRFPGKRGSDSMCEIAEELGIKVWMPYGP